MWEGESERERVGVCVAVCEGMRECVSVLMV